MSSAVAPGFKFGEDDGAPPRTVTKVAKVEPYIVSYVDGEGKQAARIAFRIPGAKITYMLQERLGGQSTVLPTHSWFHKAFVDKLQSEGLESDEGESVSSV